MNGKKETKNSTIEGHAHGLQYIPRNKQPSMFQLLSWKQNPQLYSKQEWMQCLEKDANPHQRFTETIKYQTHPRSPSKVQDIPKWEQRKGIAEKNLGNHNKKIKHEIYYSEQDKAMKTEKKVEQADIRKIKQRPISLKKKLDQHAQQDKQQIKLRNKNINQFRASTRDLPNSAFTTYFGKPAFEQYGNGCKDSITHIKSYNVMPHAGENKPEFVQSHLVALQKAKVINLQSKIPRKTLNKPSTNIYNLKVSSQYNVQIQKPDLINEIMFSQRDAAIQHKAKTPKHNQLNKVVNRNYQSPATKEKSRKKLRKVKSVEAGDGLKFMNERKQLIPLLQEKKKHNNRLPYKVTQCYPLDWDFEAKTNSTERQNNWRKIKPAGIYTVRSVDAKQIIYH